MLVRTSSRLIHIACKFDATLINLDGTWVKMVGKPEAYLYLNGLSVCHLMQEVPLGSSVMLTSNVDVRHIISVKLSIVNFSNFF